MIKKSKQHRFLVGLFISIPIMFGFAYLLVPIYEKICIQLGVNGKLMRLPEAYHPEKVKVDPTRNIEIRFLTDVRSNVPWIFKAQTTHLNIHPGELVDEKFMIQNLGNIPITARVIVNTIPAEAVKHVHEVASCFCLAQHFLAPGEHQKVPTGFYIDTDLPSSIKKIMMSYTLFKTKNDPQTLSLEKHHHSEAMHHEHT